MLGFVDTAPSEQQGPPQNPDVHERALRLPLRKGRPKLEKQVAAKEAEIESLLDGFAGLTPMMKDRVNKRLEALQDEIRSPPG